MKTKAIASILFLAGLSVCNADETKVATAEEQVAGIKQMCADNADAMKARQEAESLYSRLGGTEGIAEFSAKLYAAHKSNEKIGHFFSNVSEQPFIDNVTNFLVAHSGGDAQYKGSDMGAVHEGLGITNEDFLSAGGDVQAVMTELGAGENEIQEAVCFLVSYVPQVVVD